MPEVWERKTYKLAELTDTWRRSVNVETIIKLQLTWKWKKTTIEIALEASEIIKPHCQCVVFVCTVQWLLTCKPPNVCIFSLMMWVLKWSIMPNYLECILTNHVRHKRMILISTFCGSASDFWMRHSIFTSLRVFF